MSAAPIGLFDSGVGGLSVLREVRAELPHEDLCYVADSAHAPYGDKSPAEIEDRAIAIATFLIARQAKALVVACNTATGVAVETLRQRFPVPIIGIEPAIKPAVALTTSGVIGVLATSQTLASQKFRTLVDAWRGQTEVLLQACPGLVEQIEKGDLASDATRSLVAQYVEPLVARGADTLVLGCTHYPFVSAVIQSVAGPQVRLIDPARAVAREVRRRLEERGLLSASTTAGALAVHCSGSADQMRAFMALTLPGAGTLRAERP